MRLSLLKMNRSWGLKAIGVSLLVTYSFHLQAAGLDTDPSTDTTGFTTENYLPGLTSKPQRNSYKGITSPLGISGTQSTERKSPIDNITVSGVIRFMTYARWMDKYYADMRTSPRNISFLDYPTANAGAAAGAGFPMMELNFTSKISPNFDFNIGYSIAHSLSGSDIRGISSRQNLRFTGFWNTKISRTYIAAGGMLWTTMSRFTMSQPDYRDSYFDRMPWDWYRNSFLRYDEYYTLATNIGNETSGRSPVLGYVVSTDFYKAGIKFLGVFGRTNTTVSFGNASNNFPALTYAGRLEKTIFNRHINGKIALNAHTKFSGINRVTEDKDNTELYTVDFGLKFKPFRLSGEIAYGRNINPYVPEGASGLGFDAKIEFDKHTLWIPLSLEFYHIDIDVVSLDGAILNSNSHVEGGGYGTGYLYDPFRFINVAQEVGQIANNRWGVILKTDKQVGKLKIQFNMDMSSEIENLSDTITFQHRVNAFARSRFYPWYQASGPYGRIKGVWMRTFEAIQITDEANGISRDYLKGFNGMELFLRYKAVIFGKEVVFMNFNSFNSITQGFRPIPSFSASNNTFVRTFYEDFNIAVKTGRKWSVRGFFGIEKVWGGERTNLSEDLDADGNIINKPINQTGTGYGLGVDYDFAKNAGIHLAHRWIDHKDTNFTQDVFKGQETIIELKIFF